MIHRPKIGMRVRIIRVTSSTQWRGGELIYRFDSRRSDKGTIIDIVSYGAGHRPKNYMVELDSPNEGVMDFYGTSQIEKLEAEDDTPDSA